ncbi:MAG TPA: hypothetical protein PKD05_02275 [Candidatus Melainabacteria bacterium]|nr:hypothetical protein [Candidatus Melainabacteria bacterium]
MSKATNFKSVVVKEDQKTSLAEAGIFKMTLADGMRAVALAHVYFPHHDRKLFAKVLDYLRDTKPAVVFLLGGMVDEEVFRSLGEDKQHHLHDWPDVAEVVEAKQAGGFEDMILKLGELCGKFIESIQEAAGGKVVYIPSATHLSMSNEIRIMEWIQQTKRVRDGWSSKNPEASDLPSDPTIELPRKLEVLFNLHKHEMIRIIRYGAAVEVNGDTLFMIGDFRRRHPGGASLVEWEQRHKNIVRSFDGKVFSGYFSSPKHTLPSLQLNHWETHEVGYLWDAKKMGQLRDYDRRAQGFWTGIVVEGELFGQSVPIVRGDDNRRSFWVDGRGYIETEPNCCATGDVITVGPRKLEVYEHDDPRRPLAPPNPHADEEGEEDED